MDFKVTYLDAGLTSAYFSDSEIQGSAGGGGAGGASGGSGGGTANGSSKIAKRYKTHLKDFLSSCRTKRKPAAVNDIYSDYAAASAAGYAAANPAASSVGYSADSPLYMQQNISAAASPYQSIYTPVDNRAYFPPEYLARYQSLAYPYSDYTHAQNAAIAGYSYFDVTNQASARSALIPGYDPATHLRGYFDEKGECKYNYHPGMEQVDKDKAKELDKNKSVKEVVKCEPLNVGYDYGQNKDVPTWQVTLASLTASVPDSASAEVTVTEVIPISTPGGQINNNVVDVVKVESGEDTWNKSPAAELDQQQPLPSFESTAPRQQQTAATTVGWAPVCRSAAKPTTYTVENSTIMYHNF